MRTTREEILSWIESAQTNKATHLIIVCDTFEYEDYPVEVKAEEKVMEVYAKYDGKDMQRVMEVYDLSMDIPTQLAQPRARNFGK